MISIPLSHCGLIGRPWTTPFPSESPSAVTCDCGFFKSDCCLSAPALSHHGLPRQKYPEHKALEGCNIPWRRNDVIVLRREPTGGSKTGIPAQNEARRHTTGLRHRAVTIKTNIKYTRRVPHCGTAACHARGVGDQFRPIRLRQTTGTPWKDTDHASTSRQLGAKRVAHSRYSLAPTERWLEEGTDLAGRLHTYGRGCRSAQARNRALQPGTCVTVFPRTPPRHATPPGARRGR